jgi:hypothetical protein
MAEGHGGMRRPASPAPVSGPGALSQRTDGQGARYIAGGEYGEGQEMMDLQTSAPMAKSPEVRSRRRAAAPPAVEMGPAPTPLFAPTERPDEPITAGASFGPGPGPTVTPRRGGNLAATLERLASVDDSGAIAAFYRMAQSRGW